VARKIKIIDVTSVGLHSSQQSCAHQAVVFTWPDSYNGTEHDRGRIRGYTPGTAKVTRLELAGRKPDISTKELGTPFSELELGLGDLGIKVPKKQRPPSHSSL
jgi:hypothetical protein